jgi:hypothetical protein
MSGYRTNNDKTDTSRFEDRARYHSSFHLKISRGILLLYQLIQCVGT